MRPGDDQSVVVPAQKKTQSERKHISPHEFYQYQGSDALRNGQSLTLSRRAVRLSAQFGQQPRQEAQWYGDGRFSKTDDGQAMNIVPIDDDTATGNLNYMPSLAGAQPGQASLNLASR
jgi:hypothetical protein